MKKTKPLVVFLAGPTAVGKTRVSEAAARLLNAEIISCDSMQVYTGLDILSSKLPPALRKKIPHYLIDCVSPDKEYDVSRYRREAVRKIKEICARGRVPLFVGGTGLYMSVVIDGLFNAGKPDEKVRAKLSKLLNDKGNEFLYHYLKRVDPEAAGKIHPHDTKRVIRALEVFETTGTPISVLQKQRKGLARFYDIRIFCLNMDREVLYRRINERVERMFRQGVLNEVVRLLSLRLSKTAYQAIGIRELERYCKRECPLEEAKEAMKHNTRLYAKRQLTWFRKDKRIQWVEISENDKPLQIAKRIVKEINV
ncbi:MAG: tRNA (adenosine(37)-N6)-dimethylallyltransferase MiaA [Candidatus Omnitrophica bacterium]|nr:tRNA (adenosine(37)-N6)-dimethylallyltransferase MiaA [Candidatus Omnitrophota bacterium]